MKGHFQACIYSIFYLSDIVIYFQCLADVEAFIDFSEDQDIEETVVNDGNESHHKKTCLRSF